MRIYPLKVVRKLRCMLNSHHINGASDHARWLSTHSFTEGSRSLIGMLLRQLIGEKYPAALLF